MSATVARARCDASLASPAGQGQAGDYGTDGGVEAEHLGCCCTDECVREHRYHERSALGVVSPPLDDSRQHEYHGQ